MAEEKTQLEIPIAVKSNTESKDYTIHKSLVEKQDFTPEELNRINARLQALQDNTDLNLEKHDGKLIIATAEKKDELAKELKAKKDELTEGDDRPELTAAEVEKIISDDDFQKNPTTEQVAQQKIEGVTAVAAAVLKGNPTEALKALEDTGIMPDNIIKKIWSFFHNIFGDKRISFDQKTTFDNVIAPFFKAKGLDLTTTKINKETNKPYQSINGDTRVNIMKKLSTLGVPVEETGKFLGFVMGDITTTADIPENLVHLFGEGRAHYQSIESTLDTSNPRSAVDAILNFTPTKREEPSALASTDKPTDSEKTTDTRIKFTKDGKDVLVDADGKTKESFLKIQKNAETILGKDYKVEDKIAEAYSKNTETDEKKKGESVLKEVAIILVQDICNKTEVIGDKKINIVNDNGKMIDLSDGTFIGDPVLKIEEKLTTYLPLAFKELNKRVAAEVDKKFTPSEGTGEPLLTSYKETRESIQKTVLGSFSEENQDNYPTFKEKTQDGYALVFRGILEQAEKIKNIDQSNINEALLIAYKENSPLTIPAA